MYSILRVRIPTIPHTPISRIIKWWTKTSKQMSILSNLVLLEFPKYGKFKLLHPCRLKTREKLNRINMTRTSPMVIKLSYFNRCLIEIPKNIAKHSCQTHGNSRVKNMETLSRYTQCISAQRQKRFQSRRHSEQKHCFFYGNPGKRYVYIPWPVFISKHVLQLYGDPIPKFKSRQIWISTEDYQHSLLKTQRKLQRHA